MGEPSKIPRPMVAKLSTYNLSDLKRPVPSSTKVKLTTRTNAETKSRTIRTRTTMSSIEKVDVEDKTTGKVDGSVPMDYMTSFLVSLTIFFCLIGYCFISYKAYQFLN